MAASLSQPGQGGLAAVSGVLHSRGGGAGGSRSTMSDENEPAEQIEENMDAMRSELAEAYEKFQQELPPKLVDEALNGKPRTDFDPEEMKILRDMWTAIEAHIKWCNERGEPRYTVDGAYEFAKNVINQILYIKAEPEYGE
jgi:hypothetical protein